MKKLALLVATLFACAASAASAAAPTVVESYVNRDVTIPAGPDFCAFPIAAHVEGFRRVTTFTDNDGNVVKTTILLHAFTITYTNPLSGKSLSTPLAGPGHRRAAAGRHMARPHPGERRPLRRAGSGPHLRERRPPDRPPGRAGAAGGDHRDPQERRDPGRERVPGGLRALA